MRAPLLDHEVLRLNNSNYMELLVAIFKDFDSITVTNYSELFKKSNSSIHTVDASNNEVQFTFRSDNTLVCHGNLIFKQRKLDSFTYGIKPMGYFKKRASKKQFQRVLAMFTKIGEAEQANIETYTDNVAVFHFNNGKLTITNVQFIFTGAIMVSVIFGK